jgi:hypothetical protein
VQCLSGLKLDTKAKAEQKPGQKPKVLGEVNVVPTTETAFQIACRDLLL